LVTGAFFHLEYLDEWIKGPLKKGACHQFRCLPLDFAVAVSVSRPALTARRAANIIHWPE
jgi:hypothetical protein